MKMTTETTDAVRELLEGGFARVRVLVVGDLMLDRYILGEVERISPEAPVPILKHAQRYERPGGAANVAMNLAGLGCETFLCGFWGHDHEQTELARLLEAGGVDTAGVVTSTLPTVSKTRFVARTQQLLRLDIEGGVPAPAEELVRLEARAAELVKKVHAVILVDRGKGALTDELCSAVLRGARSAGVPVVVDPKGRNLGKYSGATTVCPTHKELAAATGVAEDDEDRLMAVARVQMQEHDLRFLTIQMVEKGMRVLGAEEDFQSTCDAGEVFDVAGVEDAVIAVLAASLAAGLPMAEGVELANRAAEIVLRKIGAVPVTGRELAMRVGMEAV
jgi:D-beta-D-heptose 7-phosphate kinase/D-beta-D-heptose 1-phosphate adenosyltransferase